MRTQRWFVGLGAGSLLLLVALAFAPLAGIARQDATPPAQIDEAAAATIAQEAHPDTAVVGIESEEEDGRLLYEVELSNGVEVAIDAATGEIVETEQGEGEDADEEGDEGEDTDEPGDVDAADDEDDEDDDAEQDDDEDVGEDDEDAAERAFTDTFDLDGCDWSSTGGNAFFRLEPGLTQVLRGDEDGATVEAIITVLDETETVGGIETRVVEERESEDGELVEVSRNYFAVCTQTGSVFYFGETVDDYENGQIVGHDGAWRADEGENQVGLIMPAQPLIGARFYTEIAPDVAVDRTEIVALPVTAEVPAGTFEGCFVAVDTDPLDPGEGDEKVHCPGVGIVQDESVQLVYVGPAADAPAAA